MAIGCGTRTARLAADLPSAEWSAAFSSGPDLEIAPNSANTVSVSVGISASVPPGLYNLSFRASDNETGMTGEAVIGVEVLIAPPPDNVTAVINSISPNPAEQWTTVDFSGTGSDSLGHFIAAYSWRSSIDEVIGESADFGKSDLSVGSHDIYFKVKCDSGIWSPEISWPDPLVINSASPPCKAEIMTAEPSILTLKKKTCGKATVTLTGADGCQVKGAMVAAAVISGKKRITVSPSSAATDENGQAEFTIAAKKNGKSKITFHAGSLKSLLTVKVKKKLK